VRGKQRLPSADAEGRSLRARVEPMAVRPLRDRRYVVETEGGTYVVDLEAGTCTCPDHAIRGARCKHLRRVAIEVTEGRVPAPGERRATCAVCGRGTFVPATAAGPALCDRHAFAAGDVARDRERGSLLVVVAARDARADAVRTDEGRLVSEYETNAAYGRHEPVFDCVYLASLPVADDAADVGGAKRYSFPASRLRRLPDAESPGRLRLRGTTADADGGADADAGTHTPRSARATLVG
jgi:hypothetical protein